jgi:phosphoglycolate phosphatase
LSIEAILFDLDGTLVDTAPDLVAVLNGLLTEHGRARVPYAIARNEVSNGAAGLLRLGFPDLAQGSELERLRTRFLEIYAQNICVGSRLFIALAEVREHARGHAWGIVTNKPGALTDALLERLGLAGEPGCVIGGDRLPIRKPDPAPLLLAAEELGVAAARCVYIGDAPRDVEAGRAAGMATVAARYGYIRPRENVAAWGADRVLEQPRALGRVLAELRAGAA